MEIQGGQLQKIDILNRGGVQFPSGKSPSFSYWFTAEWKWVPGELASPASNCQLAITALSSAFRIFRLVDAMPKRMKCVFLLLDASAFWICHWYDISPKTCFPDAFGLARYSPLLILVRIGLSIAVCQLTLPLLDWIFAKSVSQLSNTQAVLVSKNGTASRLIAAISFLVSA